uniref:Uncharacterized protein n=1 Tax=Cacopsylla melanoneura TaxID=428564 RepID=A0A8D8SGP0_9HEMI
MTSNCTLLLSLGTTLSPLQLIWADLPRPGLKNLPTFLSTLRLLRPPLLPLRPLMTGPPLSEPTIGLRTGPTMLLNGKRASSVQWTLFTSPCLILTPTTCYDIARLFLSVVRSQVPLT